MLLSKIPVSADELLSMFHNIFAFLTASIMPFSSSSSGPKLKQNEFASCIFAPSSSFTFVSKTVFDAEEFYGFIAMKSKHIRVHGSA